MNEMYLGELSSFLVHCELVNVLPLKKLYIPYIFGVSHNLVQ